MSPEIIAFIIQYGYFAIFVLVFLQEIGIPNPVPNELILLFSGYLAYEGTLNFPLIFLTAVAADFIGTALLYSIFYFFGTELMRKAPRWISTHKIEKLKIKIIQKGKLGIYLGRLIPYARGYVSVAAGLIRIPPKIFLMTVIISALTWSGGYVIAGRIFGKQWNDVAAKFGMGKTILVLLMVILLVYGFLWIKRKVVKFNNF